MTTEKDLFKQGLSIADRCSSAFNGPDDEDNLMESDVLADTIAHIVGAKTGGGREPEAFTPADELARILARIRRAVSTGASEQLSAAINTLDEAFELAFLHTPTYQASLALYRLHHEGKIRGSGSAYELINGALQRARGKPVSRAEES